MILEEDTKRELLTPADWARYWEEHYLKKKARDKKQLKRRQLELKEEVFIHYGNGKLACVQCGFDDIRALSIDHIAGGGKKHKDGLFIARGRFYYWLKTNNFPDGYQTLCMNCQWIKRFERNEHN